METVWDKKSVMARYTSADAVIREITSSISQAALSKLLKGKRRRLINYGNYVYHLGDNM